MWCYVSGVLIRIFGETCIYRSTKMFQTRFCTRFGKSNLFVKGVWYLPLEKLKLITYIYIMLIYIRTARCNLVPFPSC